MGSSVNCFAAAEEGSGAIPLITLRAAQLGAYWNTATLRQRLWMEGAGFRAEPNTWLMVPGENGKPVAVLAGIEDANDPYALSFLPMALAEGSYRLDPASPTAIDAGLAALGWGLGAYQFDRYRKPNRAPARLAMNGEAAALSDSFAQLKASLLVRDLVNTPTEDLGPDQLEAVARRLAQAYGGEVCCVTGEALLKENFPAIHAVGRASHRAPRLIELVWGDASHPRISIIGKGVCFDTGGLDIKPSDGMRKMKKDMGGAAHALALAQLVMAQKLPVRLQLLVPAVENAIGPNSYRPGEVLKTRAGLTVEIDNTDAEGRLILCDALTYAVQGKPQLVLDFATLTGAARVALGPDLPALFGNDAALRNAWFSAGDAVRDPLWPMPLYAPYQHYLKSPIADLVNTGTTRMAGCITAALYLQRFVPSDLPWCHLDTYSWNDSDRPGKPAGGEAQGLRAAWAMLKLRFAG
jgi:leucyl aminopeptidase